VKFFTFILTRWWAIVLAGSAVSLLSACSYTNGYEAPAPCNLPETVTYQLDVLPILVRNCYSCHSANEYQVGSSGTLNMEKFSELKAYTTAASGHGDVSALLGNIRQDPGFNAMPQGGGKLTECEIALIKAWIDQGAPQN
jgi:hypothetical protein